MKKYSDEEKKRLENFVKEGVRKNIERLKSGTPLTPTQELIRMKRVYSLKSQDEN